MNINPYDSPKTAGQPPEKIPGKRGFRLVELLVVVGIIGVLVALLLPMRRSAREAARRMSCQNNLKQIAIALHNYEEVYDCLPPAYTVDANGKPLHSWRTLILPYLEQKWLYEKIDLTKSWDDPVNKVAYDTKVSTYKCPSASGSPTDTAYLAVVGPGCCFQATEPRRLAEMTDALSLTLMVIEMDAEHAVHWMSPTDASERSILSFGESRQLPHPGGTQAAFVDCRVSFLPKGIKPATLQAAISASGNDNDAAREIH